MKKLFLIALLSISGLTLCAQVKSDTEMGTYNNTYIRPGIENGVRAANHNMFNRYIIASKIHKDSLDNVYSLGDTALVIIYKGVADTVPLTVVEELNDLSDVNLNTPDASDILMLDDETMKWVNYPFSNLIGDINDSLPNYWYLDGDTIKTIYNVVVDSSFLMKYGNWTLGYDGKIIVPTDIESMSGGYYNAGTGDKSIFNIMNGSVIGKTFTCATSNGDKGSGLILSTDYLGSDIPYATIMVEDTTFTGSVIVSPYGVRLASKEGAPSDDCVFNMDTTGISIYTDNFIEITCDSIVIDELQEASSDYLVGWNSLTKQLVAADTALITELDNLSDVVLTTPDASDMLILDDETMKWVNRPLIQVYGDMLDTVKQSAAPIPGNFITVYSKDTTRLYSDFSTAVGAAKAGDLIELNPVTFTETGTVTMPANTTLKFYEGAQLSGTFTLVGDSTRLSAGLWQCFGDNVTLAGTWVIEAAHSEWFGVTGSGNETARFQKAIDFANLSVANKDIIIQPGKFTIDYLRLYSNQSFVGSGIDNTIFKCEADTGIYVRGSISSSIDVTSNITANDTLISVDDASSLLEGDLIYISSLDTVAENGDSEDLKGEMAVIKKIKTNDIYLTAPVSDSYTTALDVIVRKLTPVENTKITDITLDFSETTTNEAHGIYLIIARNPVIERVKIDSAMMWGIDNVLVRGGYFNNLKILNTLKNGYGYSFGLSASEYNFITNSEFIRARHCTNISQGNYGGVSRYNVFDNIIMEGTRIGSGVVISTHACGERNTFHRCVVRDGIVGISMRGDHNVISDCEVYNTDKAFLSNYGDSTILTNFTAIEFRDAAINLGNSPSNFMVDGAFLSSSIADRCIYISSGGENGHTFKNITAYGKRFTDFINNSITNIEFMNCDFKSTSTSSTAIGYNFLNTASANTRFGDNNIRINGGSIEAYYPIYLTDYWSKIFISNIHINGYALGSGVYSNGVTENIKLNNISVTKSKYGVFIADVSDTSFYWDVSNCNFTDPITFSGSYALYGAFFKTKIHNNLIDNYNYGFRPNLGLNIISNNRIINTTYDYRFDAAGIGNSFYFNTYDDAAAAVYSDGGVTRIADQFWIENNGQYLGVDTTGSFTLDVNGDINATGSYYLDSELVIDNTGDPAILLNTTAPYTSIKGALFVGASHASPAVELVISGDADISGTLSVNTIEAENFTITPKMALSAFRSQPYYFTDFLYPTIAGLNPWYGAAISSGTISETGDVDNHPGIGIIRNATGDNSGFRITTSTNALSGIFGGELSTAIVNFPILDSVAIRIGFHDATTTSEPTDGIYFEMLGDSLVGKTSSVSTRSTTSSYNISIDTWYRLEIEVNNNADTAFFYVYNEAGTELWSDNLQTNIPATRATGHGIIATKPPTGHGVAGNLLFVDYLDVYLGTLVR